ncbi:hypothetical protein [Alloactinosynnema sp. L-07]|nr:hypothetical protein [Alloactinosynnema sp. L-07]
MEVGDYRIMTEQMLAMMFFADQWNIGIRVIPAGARHRALFGGSFRYLGYPKHKKSLVYVDATVGTLFLEDPKYVQPFRTLLPKIANVSLDVGESRVLIAKLADEYDRAEGGWDDAWRVAQERL